MHDAGGLGPGFELGGLARRHDLRPLGRGSRMPSRRFGPGRQALAVRPQVMAALITASEARAMCRPRVRC